MQCPGCGAAMRVATFDAVLGGTVDVCTCLTCRAFWFEPFETLHLTRQSTLALFRLISEQPAAAAAPFPTHSRCPVCNAELLLTHDRQRTTAFQYWRCDAGHGRFTAFIDFLREKDFVKPLTPPQMAELRQNVQTIRCSGCGATIDLAHDTVCAHCGAQVSMLDTAKLHELVSGPSQGAYLRPSASEHAMPIVAQSSFPPFSHGGVTDLLESGLRVVGKWLEQIGGEPG